MAFHKLVKFGDVEMKKLLLLAFVVMCMAFSLSSYVYAQSAKTREENLLRRVKGRTLASTSTPSIRVKFGKAFKHPCKINFTHFAIQTLENLAKAFDVYELCLK